MSEASDRYNALPFETRVIVGLGVLEEQINGLKREKLRLKRRYDKSLAEINVMIHSCENDLIRDLAAINRPTQG